MEDYKAIVKDTIDKKVDNLIKERANNFEKITRMEFSILEGYIIYMVHYKGSSSKMQQYSMLCYDIYNGGKLIAENSNTISSRVFYTIDDAKHWSFKYFDVIAENLKNQLSKI